jgi:hypothetical protein
MGHHFIKKRWKFVDEILRSITASTGNPVIVATVPENVPEPEVRTW